MPPNKVMESCRTSVRSSTPENTGRFLFCVLQGNLCGIINVLIEFVSTYGLMYIYVVGAFQFVW